MSEELVIRRAKLGDVPAMARIERKSFDSPWSADEIAKDVTAGDSVYAAVAECGGETAGYADMRIVAGEAQIYNIAVTPGSRRRGIGEALLEHMIEAGKERGCSLVTLEVRAGNEAAMELYKKLGFHEVGRRASYYAEGGEDAVLMDLETGTVEIDVEL